MTLTVSSEYQTKNELDYKVPIYVAHIEGLDWSTAWLDTSDAVWLDTSDAVWADIGFDGKFSTINPLNSSTTILPLMKKPTSLSRQVIPEEGKSSISQISLHIIDGTYLGKNNIFTYCIYSDSDAALQGRTCTVYAGYLGMNEEDMVAVYTGTIQEYSEAGYGHYKVDINDPMKQLQDSLFKKSIDVADAWETATEYSKNDLCENDLVTYKCLKGHTSGASSEPGTGGSWESYWAESEYYPRYFYGNFFNLLLMWLTSTGNGTNGDWDCLPEEDGLGITSTKIDIDGILEIKNNFYAGEIANIFVRATEKVKAKDFFEIGFKIFGLYPKISGSGVFGITSFRPPYKLTSEIKTIDESDLAGDGKIKWSGNLKSLLNAVFVKADYDYTTGEYRLKQLNVNSTSRANRGPGSRLPTVEMEWLSSSYNRHYKTVVSSFVGKLLGRYSTPPIELNVPLKYKKHIIEAGDWVDIENRNLPDIASGVRGLESIRCEVIKSNVKFDAGRVDATLLDTGNSVVGIGKYQVISPAYTVLSYDVETCRVRLSAADIAKITNFTNPVIMLHNPKMRRKSNAITVQEIGDDYVELCTHSYGSGYLGLDSGLILHAPFDEGSGLVAYDKSGYGNDGDLEASMTDGDWVTGKVGKALEFDGSNDYVDFGNDAPLDDLNTEDWTIAFWIKTAGTSPGGTYERIFSKDDGTGRIELYDANGANVLRLGYGDGVVNESANFSSSDIWDQEWHHIALVFALGTYCYLNIDGSFVSYVDISGISSAGFAVASSLEVGGKSISSDFPGMIDDVRIYNRRLHADEITALADYPDLRSGLVLCLPMNEGTGSTVYDYSGGGNDGSITGTINWNTDDAAYGKCLEFPTAKDSARVTVPHDTAYSFTTGDFSVSFWWRDDAQDPNKNLRLVSKGVFNDTGWEIFGGKDAIVLRTYPGGGTSATSKTEQLPMDKLLHHIVVTRSGTTVNFYIDGVYCVNEGEDAVDCAANTGTLRVGNYQGSNRYTPDGIMDELRIYDRVLSAGEIKALYNFPSGEVPEAGWIATFADYDYATEEQQGHGYLADSNETLGADEDDPHLIVP
jgi:hypothetical protein